MEKTQMGQAWQVRLRINELSGPQHGLSLRSRDATPAGLTSSPSSSLYFGPVGIRNLNLFICS